MKQLPADKILRLDALLRGARSVAVNTAPFGISGSSLKIIGLTARI